MRDAHRVLSQTLIEIVRERVRPGDREWNEEINTEWTAEDYALLGWIVLHHRRGVTLDALAEYLGRDRRDIEQDVYRLYAADQVEFTDGLRVRLARDW